MEVIDIVRDFFVFSDDPSRTDLQWIQHQELGGFDLASFFGGCRLDPALVGRVRLLANDNPATDLIPNPIGLIIVSSRMKAILERLIRQDDVQFLEAPLFFADNGNPIAGYFIVNPLRIVAALTQSCAAGKKIVNQLEIDPGKVADNLNFFRLAERRTITIVSDEIIQGLSGHGLQGVMALRIKSVRV